MLRGYRYIVLAAVGWLIVSASDPKSPADRAKQQAASEVAQAAPSPTPAPTLQPVHPTKYMPPCREPESNERCNLEATWKAAEASRDAAEWALAQMLLSAFGVVGLLYSLHLTRRAVKDTGSSVTEARRSADAAHAANALTEQSLKNEYRPWLDFDIRIVSAAIGAVNVEISYEITIRNIGKSPALKVTYASEGVQAYDIPSDYHRRHVYDVGVEVPDRAAFLQRERHSPSIMPNGQHVITDTACWHKDKVTHQPMGSPGEFFPMVCIGVWYQWSGEPDGHVTGHYFKIFSRQMANKSVLVDSLEAGRILDLYVDKVAPNKIT